MTSFSRLCCIILLFGLIPFAANGRAEELDYAPADKDLKAVRIDTAPSESFLGLRLDSLGRIFVGGREELFVYEPNKKGGYEPRKQLFKFPKDSWVYDIEIRGNDLYVMTVSALYLLPDAVVKREGVKAKRLIWGVPNGHVHQCFHGLAWGPEGDLYFSMGDPLWYYGDFSRPDHWGHWTFYCQPDGTKIPYTGVGGVFRCKPDGSEMRIVARGTRNSCGLVFDQNWNLFTNDNDHESIPADYVPGRLLYVSPQSYFSWPRGWLLSKTPQRADLLETMFDGMGRAVPVGQSYYGDRYLADKFQHSLLVARWCTREVTYYPIEPRGAGFKTTEKKLLVGRNQARPVSVTVGRGGRIFATVCYMAHNEGSPVYKSDLVMIVRKDDKDDYPFEAIDLVKAKPDDLWEEVTHPDWSRRSSAHCELLRREDVLSKAAELEREQKQGNAMMHWPWLISAGPGSGEAAGQLRRLAQDGNPLVRVQAIRALVATEWIDKRMKQRETTLALADRHPAVRHAALAAFFHLDGPLPEAVAGDLALNTDTYLRQCATLLLAEKAAIADFGKLIESKDAKARLAGVLAVGFRLTIPPATQPIPEHLPLADLQSKDAYTLALVDETVDLRKLGRRIGNFTVAEHWKAGKHTEDQEKLFALLQKSLDDTNEQVRLQAAHFLSLLNDPRTEPGIAKLKKESEERRLINAPLKAVNKAWIVGPFADGDKGLDLPHPPESGALDLAASYEGAGAKLHWKEATGDRMYDFSKTFGKCDKSSFYAYSRLESVNRERILLLVGSDDHVRVWLNGKEVWTSQQVRGALPFQDVIPVELQPGSNDLLVRVHNETGECALYMHYRALGSVVARLPEKLSIETLADRLKAAAGNDTTKIGKEFLEVDWTKAVAKGDAEKGRKLFAALSCVKCHAIVNEGASTGGPSLAESRKRFTIPYMVESILLPSKQISPIFRSTHIETKKGLIVSGLVVSETAEMVEVLLPDATRKTLPKSDIAERKLLDASPMPAGVIKTPDELRDLLAYLLSEKPTPP